MAERAPFQIVPDEDDPPSPKGASADKSVSLLLLAIKTLGQRALVAITDLFTLITVASAWFLWWITPDPTVLQIAKLSIYAVFVLAANVIVRRK